MIDTVSLKAAFRAFVQDYRTQVKDAIFGADLPLLGDDFLQRADAAMSFIRDMLEAVERVLDGFSGAATPPTVAELAAALATVEGISASVGLDGNLDFTFDTDGLVGGIVRQTLDAVMLDSDLGLSTGGFEFGGVIEDLAAEINARLVFEVDATTGALSFDGAASTEFEMSLTGDIALDATAQLGFLEVEIEDRRGPDNPEVQIDFSFDFPGIGTGGATANASFNTTIDLGLTTSLPSDVLPTIEAGMRLSFNAQGQDLLAPGGLVGVAGEISLYDIAIDMNGLADFFDGVFGQLTRIMDSFPIGIIIDVLTERLPVIDDLAPVRFDQNGDEVISLRDLAGVFGPNDQEFGFIDALISVLDIIDQIESLRGLDGRLELGDISLSASATAALGGTGSVDTGDLFDTSTAVGASAQEILDDLGAFGDALRGPLDGLFGGAGAEIQTGVELLIPWLDNPLELVGSLLFNGLGTAPVTLIELDLPPLAFGAEIEIPFNFGPIKVAIFGAIDGGIDFSFGYDTSGFAAGGFEFADGFFLGSNVNEGFGSLGLTVGVRGGLDLLIAEAGAEGSIRGEIMVNLVSSSTPDAQGNIKTYLSDLASFPCIFTDISGTLTATAALYYEVGFGFLKISDRFELASVTLAEFNLPDPCPPGHQGDPREIDGSGLATLTPGLLTLSVGSKGTDRNGIGYGENGNPLISENFLVTRAIGTDDDPALPGEVIVSAFGVWEHFGDDPGEVFNRIYAHGGQGNDNLMLAQDVVQDAILNGGAGNDVVVGGAGDDTLNGGSQNDFVSGGDGEDELYGDSGDDTLDGGAGADLIDGGTGVDRVDYSNSGAAVEMEVILTGPTGSYLRGIGGDAQGDILTSIETVIGSAFDDILRGNYFQSNVLQGGDGNDFLEGGQQADLLMGGRGADELRGGQTDAASDDQDAVTYALSSAAVTIDLNYGYAFGGEATGDTFFSIENFQLTDFGDVFIGDGEANLVEGRGGDDFLDGRGGADDVRGGAGADVIYARLDGDSLDGGGFEVTGTYAADAPDEADTLSYERFAGFSLPIALATAPKQGVLVSLLDGTATTNGTPVSGVITYVDDTITGMTRYEETVVNGEIVLTAVTVADHSSFENLTGSDHNDDLEGDMRANTIIGGLGNDILRGAGGNDWLIGGGGADELRGGTGIDWVDYSGSASGVTVEFGQAGVGGDAQGDTWFFVENILGSDEADVLRGDGGDNVIDPGAMQSFAETVDGGGGVDMLRFAYTGEDDLFLLLDIDGYGDLYGQDADGPTSDITLESLERVNLTSGSGDDSLISLQSHDDVVWTGAGDDNISMGLGRDIIRAGDGDDVVLRGFFSPQLRGLDGSFSAAPVAESFWLDGGAGIDTLWIDLSFESRNIRFVGDQPNVEGGQEYYIGGGFISGFERFGVIATGSGDDYVLQYGEVNNAFYLNEGADTAVVGYGFDYVDGGESTEIGGGEHIDTLLINYRGRSDGAIISDSNLFGVPLGEDHIGTIELRELVGPQEVGSTVLAQVDYRNFESMRLFGTNNNDVIYGLGTVSDGFAGVGDDRLFGEGGNDAIYGAFGADLIDGGSGNDELFGEGGDDVLIGGLGADTLDGGNGNDTLTAGVFGVDDGFEYMTGGTGADTFVLGSSQGRFYTRNFFQVIQDGVRIMDFSAVQGDVLVLAGEASEYSYVYDGSTSYGRLQHTQTIDNGNGTFSFLITVVAELEGITSVNLTGPNVTYVPIAVSMPSQAAFLSLAPAAIEVVDTVARTVPLPDDPGATTMTGGASGGYGAGMLDTATIQRSGLDYFDILISTAVQDLLAGASLTNRTSALDAETAAFGRFTNAFGMDGGIVLSTGSVFDILGENLIDNADAPAPTSASTFGLTFEEVATLGDSTIYRAEIPADLAGLTAITLADGNLLAGATGRFSGFDMDAIILSHSLFETLSDVTALEASALDVFGFNPRDAAFTAGSQRDSVFFPIESALAGTFSGVIDFGRATLSRIDASVATESGAFAMGDGGSVRFTLSEAVATDQPLYLYVAEAANNGEGLSGAVRAEGRPLSVEGDISSDLGVAGTQGDRARVETTFTLDHPSLFGGGTVTGELFHLVIVTEELPEFGGTDLTDLIDIRINGMSSAVLRDGSQATLANLAQTPFGSGLHPDLILNLVGIGALTDTLRADAYTTVLTVSGTLRQGVNTISMEVADGRDGLLDTAIFLAPISDNRNPHAVNDVFSALEDTPLTISAAELLANDSDFDGDFLSVVSVTQGENISVSLTAEGEILVTPTLNFTGTTSFGYTVSDGEGGTATGHALITFADTNDAPVIGGFHQMGIGFGGLMLLSSANLAGTDDLSGAADLRYRVTAVTGGQVEVSGRVAVTFTQADVDAGRVYVRHDGADFDGVSLTLTLRDAAGLVSAVPLELNLGLFNAFDGSDAADTFIGSRFNDALSGLGGNDVLTGAEGNDILIAGSGFDTLLGGAGSDFYYVGAGDNDVLINEAGGEAIPLMGGDRLILETSRVQDLVADRTGGALTTLRISDADAGMSVRVLNHFDATQVFRQVELLHVDGRDFFLDVDQQGGSNPDFMVAPSTGGTTWGGGGDDMIFADLTNADTIRGEAGDDILVAGRGGTDVLLGGSGSDRYVIGAGDGQTLINEAGSGDWQTSVDRLVLIDSAARDLSAIHFGNSLYITDNGVSLQARLFDHFNLGSGFRRIEEIELGDGSVYRIMRDRSGFGTSQDDFLVADLGTAVVDGGWGDDLILASRFDDLFRFEQGDGVDILVGFDTAADRLDFTDHGVDTLAEALSFASQQGADTVFDFGDEVVTLLDTVLAELTGATFDLGV